MGEMYEILLLFQRIDFLASLFLVGMELVILLLMVLINTYFNPLDIVTAVLRNF